MEIANEPNQTLSFFFESGFFFHFFSRFFFIARPTTCTLVPMRVNKTDTPVRPPPSPRNAISRMGLPVQEAECASRVCSKAIAFPAPSVNPASFHWLRPLEPVGYFIPFSVQTILVDHLEILS